MTAVAYIIGSIGGNCGLRQLLESHGVRTITGDDVGTGAVDNQFVVVERHPDLLGALDIRMIDVETFSGHRDPPPLWQNSRPYLRRKKGR